MGARWTRFLGRYAVGCTQITSIPYEPVGTGRAAPPIMSA